jgi:sigma-E factor negative regulatory protein RseA
MNEQIKEQISAFLDGELPAAEQRLVLERLARDPQLRARWSCYQLIGDSLRKSLPAGIDLGLADRVMAELEAFPAHRGAATGPLARALKPLAGLAVAASVAAVAVLGIQQMRAPEPGATQAAANPPVEVTGPAVYARVQKTQTQAARELQSAQANRRLNEYLVNHSEYAASGGMSGMLPYVRIVGHDQE